MLASYYVQLTVNNYDVAPSSGAAGALQFDLLLVSRLLINSTAAHVNLHL